MAAIAIHGGIVGKMKPNCRWVLANGTYCCKEVAYHMVFDDDDRKIRKYEPFCAEHVRRLIEQDEEED